MSDDVKYYEVFFKPFEDGSEYSMCTKGVRQPSVEEANAFLAEDRVKLKLPPVAEVWPGDREKLDGSYDFDDEDNWPIFGR